MPVDANMFFPSDNSLAYTESMAPLARPRVNGYSGGYPPGYFQRAAELDNFPEPRALSLA